MKGYKASNWTPYELTVHADVCTCGSHPKVLGHFRSLDRAVKIAEGYWNVYFGFWGDQTIWIRFELTDMRDGQLMWRNGALLDGVDSAKDSSLLGGLG